MSYAYIQDVPINWAIYERIRAELGWETPPGLVAHVVVETAGGLRYIDVWHSKEDADRFFESRVHPAVDRVLAKAGRSRAQTGEPCSTPIEVKEVWAPRQLRDGKVVETEDASLRPAAPRVI
jgi:hypothetical protein